MRWFELGSVTSSVMLLRPF